MAVCLKIKTHPNARHGYFGTPTYSAWASMIDRCCNAKHPAYHNYGGRGISIDPKWRADFVSFLKDMGVRPDGLTLDRIDPNGPYAAFNCRWATWRTQSMNRRTTVRFSAFGESKTAIEWAEDPRCTIKPWTLWGRIKKLKWSVERAITEPLSANRQIYRNGVYVGT